MPINMYNGLLLKESLISVEVLGLVKVNNVYIEKVPNAVEGQPTSWTFVYFEVDEKQIQFIVEKMSKVIKEKWYLNINGTNDVYIIFANQIFHYLKGDIDAKKEAIKYGISVGVPENQLDWSED